MPHLPHCYVSATSTTLSTITTVSRLSPCNLLQLICRMPFPCRVRTGTTFLISCTGRTSRLLSDVCCSSYQISLRGACLQSACRSLSHRYATVISPSACRCHVLAIMDTCVIHMSYVLIYRLAGRVVKASAKRAEDLGYEFRLRRDFCGVESYR